jgi:hypothetical protein
MSMHSQDPPVRVPKFTQQVETLKAVVNEAWTNCIWEYLQLATLRLADPDYARKYLINCLDDSVEFNNFVRQLDDPNSRPTSTIQIYRGWYYIRTLVEKYLPENARENYESLDKGQKQSRGFAVVKFLSNPPKAEPKKDRPKRQLSEEEWGKLSVNTRNRLLNDTVYNCGYEPTKDKDWMYSEIFGTPLTASPATSMFDEKIT